MKMTSPDTVPMGQSQMFFEVELYPQRSLSPRGFLILMICVSSICLIAGVAFMAVGAWPVLGFFGLDVLLIYTAFKLNYRSGRISETVSLNKKDLIVTRRFPNGRTREWRFTPFWARVSLSQPPCHDSRLIISSHGNHIDLGAFLTPQERRELAQHLTAALRRWRSPPRSSTGSVIAC